MEDKVRILMTIIRELSATQVCAFHACNGKDIPKRNIDSDIEYVHFESTLGSDNVKIGDLVLCETSGIHDFTVGYVQAITGYSDCIIREIGTNRICRVGNERFTKIKGLTKDSLLEGVQYKFKRKVLKAFYWGEHDYKYRFGGLEFTGDKGRTAIIKIREKWGGINHTSIPFDVVIKWNTKTTIKSILEEMTKQGYGWKEFEIEEEVQQ